MISEAHVAALLEKGYRVLFSRASDLVQKLPVARRELALEVAIQCLERFDLLILDDLAYVAKDQAEPRCSSSSSALATSSVPC